MSVFSLPPFENKALWQQAMTHSSFANEQPVAIAHNERLEFLGDAILNFVSGAYLYQRYPDLAEGELTPLRAALVDEPQLCHFAQKLNLGAYLKLGKGADQEGARQSRRLLCSAFEAMMGAYFLDVQQNVVPVQSYVVPMFESVVEQAKQAGINPKSRLQELTQQRFGMTPVYVLTRSFGPDHAKEYVVTVQVNETSYGQGKGRKKQDAEKEAAKAALASFLRGEEG